MKFPLGTKVIATSDSIHSGHTGTVAADHGQYIIIKIDDESWGYAHISTTGPGKYVHVDSRYLKKVKVTK